jgi:hypothetical protein
VSFGEMGGARSHRMYDVVRIRTVRKDMI